MIINYLTWLKSRIGSYSDEMIIPEKIITVSDLLDYLETKGLSYKNAFSNRNVVYAEINGSIVEHKTSIKNVSEITFFGPIAGG